MEPSLLTDRDALTVAMALAPGVYARNRMFGFHKQPEVRRAKARAAVLRGLVRQLSGAQGAVEGLEIERAGQRALIRYRVASLHLERHAELSEVEAACVMYMAAKAGIGGFPPNADDRALLHAALRRLVGGAFLFGGGSQNGARPGAGFAEVLGDL